MSDEYIKRDGAITRILACERIPGTDQNIKVVDAYDAVRTLPAATVREVVTCGDCIYGKKCRDDFGNEYIVCKNAGMPMYGAVFNHDFFCADGERADMRQEEGGPT